MGLVTIAVGCTGGATSSPPIDPTQDRLIQLGLAYREYNERQAKPPTKEADLKATLQSHGADDSVWTSARDGMPFVVIWNVDLREPPTWAGDKTPVIAYEKVGKDGKRMVRTTIGATLELTAAEFAACAFPPGHTPETSP